MSHRRAAESVEAVAGWGRSLGRGYTPWGPGGGGEELGRWNHGSRLPEVSWRHVSSSTSTSCHLALSYSYCFWGSNTKPLLSKTHAKDVVTNPCLAS